MSVQYLEWHDVGRLKTTIFQVPDHNQHSDEWDPVRTW